MPARTDYLNSTEMNRALAAGISGFDAAAAALAARPVKSPADFLALEEDAEALGRQLADEVRIAAILGAHVDRDLRKQAARMTRQMLRDEGEQARIDTMGPRPIRVRMPGGGILPIKTPYLRPNRKGMVGRPREKRGAGGSGRYAVLEMLGIRDGVTPLTRSKVSRMVVLASSYAEALDQLKSEGLVMDVSTMVRIAVGTGAEMAAYRDQALARALEEPLPERSILAGKRMRVSLDGGRARTRQTHTNHRKKKNGRRSFELHWREPRLITIDVLTDEGGKDPDVPPIYEVVLTEADEVFKTLTGLLRLIGAHQAAEVTFVADGADWIWARVDALITDAEIPVERVHKILDYYHASEHISDALKACKNLKEEQRRALHRELSELLLQPNGPTQVLQRLGELARGRRASKVNKEIKYLRKHLEHMKYAEWRAKRIPIGSGIVESAVKRVLTQRFKASSLCWREDHLLPLLVLRALLKSGRWDDLIRAHMRRRYWLDHVIETSRDQTSQAA